MTTIHVDFNAFTPDGRLPVLVQYADGTIQAGRTVRVEDGDGNFAEGKVEGVRADGLAFVNVNWTSWNRVPLKVQIRGGGRIKSMILPPRPSTGQQRSRDSAKPKSLA